MRFFGLSIGSAFALLLTSAAAAEPFDAAFSVKQGAATQNDSAAEGEGEGEQQVALCDFWPMGKGNSWTWTTNIIDACCISETIVAECHIHGCPVWTLINTYGTIAGPRMKVGFQTFADGWLYSTDSFFDLLSLPSITGHMKRLYPQFFTIGQPYTLSDGGTPYTPTLSDANTLVLSTPLGTACTFLRDIGPTTLGNVPVYELSYYTIANSCNDNTPGGCFAASAYQPHAYRSIADIATLLAAAVLLYSAGRLVTWARRQSRWINTDSGIIP
jgi:hypothetical protein